MDELKQRLAVAKFCGLKIKKETTCPRCHGRTPYVVLIHAYVQLQNNALKHYSKQLDCGKNN